MNDTKLVSVVIPVYNGEKYVKRLLDLILKQTYDNLDVIVVNDCSTDNSPQIASTYPFRIVNMEKNSGLSAARNRGMDEAKGEYICFIDVDDTVNEDYISSLVRVADSTGADVTAAGVIHQKATYKTQIFKDIQVFESLDDKLTATWVGRWGYVWRYLFRTEFLRQHSLRFEVGRTIEDLPFSLRALYYANKLATAPGAIYNYLWNDNSILTTKDPAKRERRHRDKKHAKELILSFAREHGFKIPGVSKGSLRYLIGKIRVKYFGGNW